MSWARVAISRASALGSERQVDAQARLHQVDSPKADEKCQSGDNLKVDEGLEPYSPDRP